MCLTPCNESLEMQVKVVKGSCLASLEVPLHSMLSAEKQQET